MKKIDLGQSIGILANVGVIAGLVFLGYELRQNNEILEQQERYTFLQNVIGFTEYSAGDADISRLLYRSVDAVPLSDLDSWRRCQVAFGLLYRWQWEFDNLDVASDGPVAEAWRTGWREIQLSDCWSIHKGGVGTAFAEFIDTHIAN